MMKTKYKKRYMCALFITQKRKYYVTMNEDLESTTITCTTEIIGFIP